METKSAIVEEQVACLSLQDGCPSVAAAAFLRFNLLLQVCQRCGRGTTQIPNLLINCQSHLQKLK